MADKYRSFSDLKSSEREDRDYEIKLLDRESDITIIAPHGGGIEQGTSEIAEAIAGEDFSLYCFNGLKGTGNEDLHITSTRFNEPQAIELVRQSQVVVAIHGLKGKKEEVYVGGLDTRVKERLVEALNEARFDAREDNCHHSGTYPSNICNQGAAGEGVQLEISRDLRRAMFAGLNRTGRRTKRPPFHRFVDAVRGVLLEIE